MSTSLFVGTHLQSDNDDGTVNASGTVEFFEPDGAFTTNKDTYTTVSLGTPNSNPMTLGADGRPANAVFLDGDYDCIEKDSSGTTLRSTQNINPTVASSVIPLSSSTTLTSVHAGAIIEASSTITLTLTAASTLGEEWGTVVKNIGSGVVTLARAAGADTIEGTAANVILAAKERTSVQVNDAENGFLMGRSTDLLTTRGDVLYVSSTGIARLALGTNTQVPQSDGTDVAWATISGGLQAVKYFGYPTTYSDAFTTDFGADANELVVSPAPTQPFVIDATPWRFTTTGTLPAGLSLATDYYIVATNATTDIELSTTPFGTPFTITDDGTGTHTIAPLAVYTKPTSNFSRVKVTIIGSGGGGGGGGDANEMGVGGGAGGAAIGVVENADIGATETITVGAAGLGVNGASGSSGNTSSFGSIGSATGGTGGTGDAAVAEANSVAGGVGVGLDIIIDGGRGGPTLSTVVTGHGGASILHEGGVGTLVLAGVAAGTDGTLGSGGGGSGTLDTSNVAGANGGGGVVIIEEYN